MEFSLGKRHEEARTIAVSRLRKSRDEFRMKLNELGNANGSIWAVEEATYEQLIGLGRYLEINMEGRNGVEAANHLYTVINADNDELLVDEAVDAETLIEFFKIEEWVNDDELMVGYLTEFANAACYVWEFFKDEVQQGGTIAVD